MIGDNHVSPQKEVDPGLDSDFGWKLAAQRVYESESQDELTTAVAMAIADAAGVSPREAGAPPIYEFVDVAALEDILFGISVGETPQEQAVGIEFRYYGYLVTLNSDGMIRIYEPEEDTAV